MKIGTCTNGTNGHVVTDDITPMAAFVKQGNKGDFWSFIKSQLKELNCPITGGLFDVGPKEAKWLLDNFNHPGQRNKKRRSIGMMVQDMETGRWKVTHQGCAFNEDGWFFDGQNRLEAIIESGQTVKLLIFFNVPNDSMSVFDLGVKRTIADMGKTSGRAYITTRHSGSVRRMIAGMQLWLVQSDPEVLACVEKHLEALDFAINSLGQVKGVSKAAVYAAIARAWYTQDRNRLRAFCVQLHSGIIEDPLRDQAVILLRNFLIKQTVDGESGSNASLEAYKKCERALVAFLRGLSLVRLYEIHEEQFPLPEEMMQHEWLNRGYKEYPEHEHAQSV